MDKNWHRWFRSQALKIVPWSLVLVVAASGMTLIPAPVLAQSCAGTLQSVMGPRVGTRCGGAPYTYQRFQFNPDAMGCTAGMFTGLLDCYPRMTTYAMDTWFNVFAARCVASTGPAKCTVMCDCGDVVLGNGSTLPVELIEFSVGSADTADRTGAASAETGTGNAGG